MSFFTTAFKGSVRNKNSIDIQNLFLCAVCVEVVLRRLKHEPAIASLRGKSFLKRLMTNFWDKGQNF